MLFFIVLYAGIQNRILSAKTEYNEEIVSQVANIINHEVVLAEQVSEGYNRSFTLPALLDGDEYTINLQNDFDLVITYHDVSYLFFLDANGSRIHSPGPVPGLNTIGKV